MIEQYLNKTLFKNIKEKSAKKRKENNIQHKIPS